MNFDLSSIVSVLAAGAAAFSAGMAYKSNRDLAKTDRERRIREVSLLANKVDAAATDVEELGNELMSEYDALFSLVGRTDSGAHQKCKRAVKEKQKAVIPMQEKARKLLKIGPASLDDEQIVSRLLKFDGYLSCINRIRGRLHAELGSVEAQRSTDLNKP